MDVSDEGIPQTRELLRAVFPKAAHIDDAYLRRLYRGNPLGETTGFSAWEGNDLIGHYLVIPIRAEVFGEIQAGIWPFQLAVHPEFKGKGIFSTLGDASIQAALKSGYAFMSGVGNEQSAPIYVKKWGYQAVGPLDVKLGFGTVPARREISGCHFRRVWDAAGVAWRLQLPERSYTVKRKDGHAHLFADTGRYGIQVDLGSFEDDWVPHDIAPVQGHPLRMWIGKDSARDWSGTLYFDVPDRLKPSALIFLWADLKEPRRPLDIDKVQYDLFDFDAY